MAYFTAPCRWRHDAGRPIAFALALVMTMPVAWAQERKLGPDVRLHEIASEFVSRPRQVIVWLPPGYESERDRRYPVLYMHDGQNVYVDWRIDEIARALIASKEIEPLIMVLVSNGGRAQDRFEDYTWTKPAEAPAGGKAEVYGRMLVEELKPSIDEAYRTLSGAADTAVGGASLGGIVSLYLGLKYPNVFGKLAVMSPAVWWDDKVIVREVARFESRPASRIWLDVGLAEPKSMVANTKELRQALIRKGWTVGTDLIYFELPGGRHDEPSFARRAGDMLKYLFPPKQARSALRGASRGTSAPPSRCDQAVACGT
ncbi:MAG: alpha/beta hydrolase [Acidobacteria bacterium]|nr:alpha/beta hydrolase [Acidobacteriota bacterium]MBA3886102.1 alpha/beta hydrolase [Acidobacteriota bacterium]